MFFVIISYSRLLQDGKQQWKKSLYGGFKTEFRFLFHVCNDQTFEATGKKNTALTDFVSRMVKQPSGLPSPPP